MLKHFANKSNVKEGQFNPSDNTDVNNDNVSVEELDCEITVDEVKKTIRSLSRYKACDYENNVADIFIDACDFISHLYCQKSILTTYLCYVLCLTICLLIICIQHRGLKFLYIERVINLTQLIIEAFHKSMLPLRHFYLYLEI